MSDTYERPIPVFGDALIAVTPGDGYPKDIPDDVLSGVDFHGQAADSSFVLAMKRLLRSIGPRRGVSPRIATEVLAESVRNGLSPDVRRTCAETLLLVSSEHGYVVPDVSEWPALVAPGPRADAFDDEPRYCWVDSLVTMLFFGWHWGGRHEWFDAGLTTLRPLVYQFVLKHASAADVDVVIDALHGEVAATSDESRPPPERAPIAERVMAVLETLRLFDLVGPVRHTARGCRVEVTGLGLLGGVVMRVHIDGQLTPEWDAAARAQGYLPANGGYVAPKDIPGHVAFN